MKTCNHAGCGQALAKGICPKHPEQLRCTHLKRRYGRLFDQCPRPACPGGSGLCRQHGRVRAPGIELANAHPCGEFVDYRRHS